MDERAPFLISKGYGMDFFYNVERKMLRTDVATKA